MDDSIQDDLLATHADALNADEADYQERYSVLFPQEMESLESLFKLAERIHALFHSPPLIRESFRTELKAELLAQAHQQQLTHHRESWRWAAIGASVTVAGVIAAAAWRGTHQRAVSP